MTQIPNGAVGKFRKRVQKVTSHFLDPLLTLLQRFWLIFDLFFETPILKTSRLKTTKMVENGQKMVKKKGSKNGSKRVIWSKRGQKGVKNWSFFGYPKKSGFLQKPIKIPTDFEKKGQKRGPKMGQKWVKNGSKMGQKWPLFYTLTLKTSRLKTIKIVKKWISKGSLFWKSDQKLVIFWVP